VILEGVAVIPVFSDFSGFFCRNSCGTGIPVFTQDSSGFLRIPEDS
jgi:biotin transporter BioY